MYCNSYVLQLLCTVIVMYCNSYVLQYLCTVIVMYCNSHVMTVNWIIGCCWLLVFSCNFIFISCINIHTHMCVCIYIYRSVWWRSWLKHCATSWKDAAFSSILDCVMGIFRWHNPSCRTTALESNQPLTETNTRNICCWCGRDKGDQCVRLHTVPPLCAYNLEIWEPQPPRTLWACNRPEQGLLCL